MDKVEDIPARVSVMTVKDIDPHPIEVSKLIGRELLAPPMDKLHHVNIARGFDIALGTLVVEHIFNVIKEVVSSLD